MKISQIEVKLIDCCGSDLSVVNAARVSMHKESDWCYGLGDDPERPTQALPMLKQQDAKLIKYLAEHKHFSPFNHCFLSFRVKAPIFVARQLVKHKFLPWNEVSRRYVDEEPAFYIPEPRARAENVKQGSLDTLVDVDPMSVRTDRGQVTVNSLDIIEVCLSYYKHLLASGVCPEVARAYLPQNMMAEWIWSGTLGAFAAMLNLRRDPHTQKETRTVAELIMKEIDQRFPVSLCALLDD